MLNTRDNHQLKLLGLQEVIPSTAEVHDILDGSLKVLLEEKYVGMTTKLNICTFLEEQTSLLNSVTEAELIFATLKNLFELCEEEDATLLQGKCLSTMTTVCVQAVTNFQGAEMIGLFSEILNFLMVLVKQVNNVKNFYVRSAAANCLLEMELCFPALLKPYVDMLYTVTVTETTTAHQQYLCLLALALRNFMSSGSSFRQCILTPSAREQLVSVMAQPETAVPEVSFSNINQVVSFIVDQMALCTSEAVVWLAEQLAHLPGCLPLLQPLLLTAMSTHYLPLVQAVHSFQRDVGDQSQTVSVLSLNASAVCLPIAHRLVALDILVDCLTSISSAVNPVGQAAAINVLLPAAFDGPETQLKKIVALADVLHSRPGAATVLIPVIESVRKEVLCTNVTKLKSALVKSVFQCWTTLKLSDINSQIPGLVSTVVEDDVSFVPFALSLEERMRACRPGCAVAGELLSLVVRAVTQPCTPIVRTEDVVLAHTISVFWTALRQSRQGADWVKTVLLYLMKHVVNREACSTVSWSSGHRILSLCYFVMVEYDPTDVYFELCEVLRSVITWSNDLDLQDRAQMYYTILTSHSTKKLNIPKQVLEGVTEGEETFKLTSAIKMLEKPVLKLSKCGTRHQRSFPLSETADLSQKDLIQEYYSNIQKTAPEACLILKCSLIFTQECDRATRALDGLALKFSVPSSWGYIDTAMIGHMSKKNFREYKDVYKIEVVCHPHKPYPVVAQIRAEFAVGDVCHICPLDPLSVEFVDFFECISKKEPSAVDGLQEMLFCSLWNDLQASCCESVTILHSQKHKIQEQLETRLGSFIISSKSDGSVYLIGIYLPPQYHLLAKLCICEEKSTITFITEDTYILTLAGNFFKQWIQC